MAKWTPERIINWAATVGEYASKLIDALIERKQHPQQAFRAAMGIIRLGKRYGNSRVEAACRRAYTTNAISFSSVDSILWMNCHCRRMPNKPACRSHTTTCVAPATTTNNNRSMNHDVSPHTG